MEINHKSTLIGSLVQIREIVELILAGAECGRLYPVACTIRTHGFFHTNRLADHTHGSDFSSTLAHVVHIVHLIHANQR